jgi:hypothetical protein
MHIQISIGDQTIIEIEKGVVYAVESTSNPGDYHTVTTRIIRGFLEPSCTCESYYYQVSNPSCRHTKLVAQYLRVLAKEGFFLEHKEPPTG